MFSYVLDSMSEFKNLTKLLVCKVQKSYKLVGNKVRKSYYKPLGIEVRIHTRLVTELESTILVTNSWYCSRPRSLNYIHYFCLL